MTEDTECADSSASSDPEDASASEDTTEDETEALTFEEMMEFGTDRVEDETSEFEGNVPNHAAELLTARATDLLQTLSNIDMRRAHEEAPDPEDEEVKAAVEEDLVDILLAVSAVKYEFDLDIAAAFEKRMEFVADFQAMQEAMADAETPEEAQEAIEEHMGEMSEGGMPMPMDAMQMGGGGPEPGDNVDKEDYDPDDDRDRHIQ
jgi:predicted RNase H-like HicB family nuclease